ncbi:hypothetical protein T4C_10266 [Trichinella pseudospiralis]|uniref:Uncharacterized protein n=1 Tax=Trichinella pseudospiralis TaxID=6337 RepID=A0A0V1IW98_TRIPS|nr:hypothetical protein T4C_10266 [Trichinella pseudospiralis]
MVFGVRCALRMQGHFSCDEDGRIALKKALRFPVQTINKKNEKGSALITITWMEIWIMKKRKSENADDTKQIADGMKQIEDDTKQNRG